MACSLKVAVIGAGVAGLVAARELIRESHRVVIYEKADQLGGTWVYNPRVETDLLGLDPDRERIHSSLYLSLRTNFPRHLMGFSDYPFTVRENGDPRDFPRHEEVLKFLNDFAEEFRLTELIRFNTEVVRVERVNSRNDEWVVESRTSELRAEEVFEAVVVCSGRFTEPRLANLPGIEKWPGKQLHSHNYRVPDPFQNQVVVIIGNGPSALDISIEIAAVAKEVHLSSRSPDVKVSKFDKYNNMWQHSKIDNVCEDGTVTFQDGLTVHADIIFHCTGYKYSFPYLRTNGIVSIEDNRVGPLYKHVFPPQLTPCLSFIGIPYMILIFPAMELQSKWVARVLSGKVGLPSEADMLADVEEHYQSMKERGVPKHHSHSLYPHQFEYIDWLAAQAAVPPVEERLKEIYRQLFKTVSRYQVDIYRDEWDVNDYWAHSTHNTAESITF